LLNVTSNDTTMAHTQAQRRVEVEAAHSMMGLPDDLLLRVLEHADGKPSLFEMTDKTEREMCEGL